MTGATWNRNSNGASNMEDRHNDNDRQAGLLTSLATVPACRRRNGDVDWFPAVDASEAGDEYLFEVDLPGLNRESIQVNVDGDVLSIIGERLTLRAGGRCLRAERPAGVFVRRFLLPEDARRGEIHATLRDGVMELRVPKARLTVVALAEGER